MKPKNLKFPYRWDDRVPLFSDHVLYVPVYYDRHHLWSKEEWFNQIRQYDRVNIEYCTGNGAWILERAKKEPKVLWIAVEKRFDRVRKIWSKMHNHQLSNLRIVCGEAFVFSQYYLEDNSIDHVYVNFPDPWPKEKHEKNRLFQEPFIDQIARVVKEKGKAMIVTDHDAYSMQIIEQMLKRSLWRSLLAEPYYVTEWPEYGSSYFDQLWREKGKIIRYMQFENVKQ